MFLFHIFVAAMIFLFRVPLRLIVGREKRNKIVTRIPLYQKLHTEWAALGKSKYEEMYGGVDYNGKTVLDVGADFGSTADFFLDKGAESVVAVEGALSRYMRLRKHNKENVKPVHLWIDSPRHFEVLLKGNHYDIAKIDCEGCEGFLLDVDDNAFRRIPYYIMETHTAELFEKFMDKFSECGYKVLSVYEGNGNPDIAVLHAEKADSPAN